MCFYSAGMLSPQAPAKDIHPIFRIHFTETYHCVPAGNSIISKYISICMNHIYSHNLHPHIHTDFTNKIQYHTSSNEFFVICSTLWVNNYSYISNLLYYQFPYFYITWLKRHKLRLPQRDKQAFTFHKLSKYRHGDTTLSMNTQTDIDNYSGSSYDASNKQDYNQWHSYTCCCWHMYYRCYQLTGPQKCSLRNWILVIFSENLSCDIWTNNIFASMFIKESY